METLQLAGNTIEENY